MNRSVLHWSYRDFREFPNELSEHSDTVQEIYLKENFIPSLPKWLFQFAHLKFIQLSGNLLQTLPNEIADLINLEHLDLSKNQLIQIPSQIGQLNKLQYLNISENAMQSLNKEFGTMKSLETLNASKNHIKEIPLELAQSTSICELILNDNEFTFIPNKIMTMPNLRVFEADRCALNYLPGIIGDRVTHLRLFNNTRLTHYPIIYEPFLCLHYDYWSENVVSADSLMIFLPDESKRTIIPHQIDMLRLENVTNSLIECCLRSLYNNQQYYQLICKYLTATEMPSNIYKCILNGPICRCGNSECGRQLFTECHFSLMKKNKTPSHIIFSNMFCSRACLTKWHADFKAKYHPIDWVPFV